MSSERRIVTVRKIDHSRPMGPPSSPTQSGFTRAADTIPAPPPSDHDTERFDRAQHQGQSEPQNHHPDTIPAGETPESTDVVVIPAHRRVSVNRTEKDRG